MPRPPSFWFWSARNVWCCTLDGKRHILARGKANESQARDEFHKLMAGRSQGLAADARRITFGELAASFLEDTAAAVDRGERAAVTLEGYVRHLKSAAQQLGGIRATDLRPHDVLTWSNDPAKGWNSTTRAGAITAVKVVTRWSRRRRLIKEDPLVDLQKPARKRRENVLTEEQADLVLAAILPGPFRDLVFCLRETGARPGELATLAATKVSPDGQVWTVRNKTRHKTGKEERLIYATAAAAEVVLRLVREHDAGPIFRNSDGLPWTRAAMAQAFARLRKKLGMGGELSAYSFRHLYATTALEREVPIATLAELMGHSDTQMISKNYSHLYRHKDHLRDAAKRARGSD
jgi:integrase